MRTVTLGRSLSVLVVGVMVSGCGGVTIPSDAQEVRSELARDMAPAVGGIDNLTSGTSDFGFDLYHWLAADADGGNVFISPYSVSLALSMAWAGAKGQTAEQMRAVLGFKDGDAETHEAFNALDLALDTRGSEELPLNEEGDPFQLSVVNQAWGRIGFDFLPGYLDILALNYGAGLYLLDFTNDPDGSRETINEWVEDQTNDRIVDLLPPESISPATALVLTNAIYFKASWYKEFNPEDTVDATFNRLDGSAVTVRMMNKWDELRYVREDGWQALVAPYIGQNVAMVLVLPDAGSFTEVETLMDGAMLAGILNSAGDAEGAVALPKFTFGFNAMLNDPLKALGMTDAFSVGDADFSGIDGVPGNLFISLVQHKTFVAVDEKGTEAAAATAVVMDEGTSVMDTFDVTFDRPFIFAIVDIPTRAPLFLGRVMDPTAE
ncbi:MAG TPA: serpin family protein [Myxococcota bacterium]|nr:serpin family protein [Myxococcota bacterium]HOD08518.1 serpin family protein [Myxococcota bacterium]HPB50823.1 serpin family protein [Myxococcota bacterium]HQP95479.1 serpin family protein [Myxococcota bacterium]